MRAIAVRTCRGEATSTWFWASNGEAVLTRGKYQRQLMSKHFLFMQ
jgi:hypothetical protein